MFQPSLRALWKLLRPRANACSPMTARRPARLRIESLEDRLTPALILPGPTLGLVLAPTGPLSLVGVANNLFAVVDNGNFQGFLNANNVLVVGANHNETITVDLNGFTLSGTLSVLGGSQSDIINVQSSVAGGKVGGKVYINPGLGNDVVNVSPALGMTFGDAVTVADPGGNDAVQVGNPTGVTQFNSDLNITGANFVQLSQGQNDVYGGNINVNVGSHGGSLDLEEGPLGGSDVITVAGNVNITGGQGTNVVALRGMVISKDLNVTLGTSPPATSNLLLISSSANSVTTVNGNTTINMANGANVADLGGGNFKSNLTVNFGTGNDLLTLETFGSHQTKIGGNLTVTGGNGNVTVTNNMAAITGSASFNLGGGNNFVSFDNGGTVGGSISYTNTGTGGNHLVLSGSQNYNVNVRFGAGDDTFTLNNGAFNLTGVVNGGGHILGNVFQVLSGTNMATVLNFP